MEGVHIYLAEDGEVIEEKIMQKGLDITMEIMQLMMDNDGEHMIKAGVIKDGPQEFTPGQMSQIMYDYYKKHVTSITLISGGSGYTTAPTVTILGGTVGSTGPFQIYGTSSSGASSGSVGYYYPLFSSLEQSNIWDSQNGGSGASHSHTFSEYSGTFYMPNSQISNHALTTASRSIKMYTIPDNVVATATATVSDGAVTKITLVTNGSNYTTTPAVILTGGAEDGSTPTDTAKAYAYLNNDLVRDFDTTIKFDRVSSTSRVVDWTASTAYAYNDLLRYNNQLYKVTNAFTSSTDL